MIKKIAFVIVLSIFCAPTCFAQEAKASEILVKQGFLAFQSGQVDKGIELLNKALTIQPDNYVALATLAQAHTDFKNEHEIAIGFFRKALTIKEDYDMALFGLGLTYQAMGMLKEAEEKFNRTIEVTERPNVKRIAQQALSKLK